ncbi:SRPBCC family protein [Herbidospora galbida]|uniref:SRPBCC family protein n=1 Tax=Herbidospora galbida TaxID=2575442 RepID=A0A4U3LNY1_9ACTN|nr:SRPBCC family protein [Herbidospora galbida]TKK77360.1 SRPBCC family protein [Herbidospora galbida]
MTDTKTASPLGRLGKEVGGMLGAAGKRGVHKLTGKVTGTLKGKVGDLTDRLTNYATGETGGLAGLGLGGSKESKSKGEGEQGEEKKEGIFKRIGHGIKGVSEIFKAITGKGGKGKGGRKVVNIVEAIDIGAPLRTVYDQWTQFEEFPSFMKKVESVRQDEDQKMTWKAQVFWSHRTWQADIIDQVPDDHIIWRSHGAKGHVDGAVSFSGLAPNMTRMLVTLEYHPQGLFEKTGNIWRAQGRRARLELKHFRRYVMNQTLLKPPDDLQGWRGEIHDGEVVEGSRERNQEKDEQERREREAEQADQTEQATESPEAPPPGSGEEPEAPEEGEESAEPEEETEETAREDGEEEERVPEGQVSARG